MSEQLSQAVSDLLNGAMQGVGDIAGWVQTDALPQYCMVQSVNHAVFAVIALIAVVLIVCLSKWGFKVIVEDQFSDENDIAILLVLSGFVILVLIAVFAVNLVPAVNWAVNPDGMVLKALLDSAIR